MNRIILTLTFFALANLSGADDIAKGKELYIKCKACHGENAEKSGFGKGQAPANLSEKVIVEKLVGYKQDLNQYGSGPMMKGIVVRLGDSDIKNVAAYISTLNKK